MKRRALLHLVFWGTFWFIYAYTYSRYDGNLGKYLLTEGLQMPARILATYLTFWFFERFSGTGETKTWLAFDGVRSEQRAARVEAPLPQNPSEYPPIFPPAPSAETKAELRCK